MSYVRKQFTKFQTVGIAIKLSETFKFQKVTAQSITKRHIKHSQHRKRKRGWTNLLKFETDCNWEQGRVIKGNTNKRSSQP